MKGPKIDKPSIDVLAKSPVSLAIAGKVVSCGSGEENPLGSPVAALTSLVNDLLSKNESIPASTFVITGHCCQAGLANRPKPGFVTLDEAKWQNGDKVEADFGEFGRVEAVLHS